MKEKLLLLFILISPVWVLAQTIDRLYTPNHAIYTTQGQSGIGINEDKPDAALHINQSDDQGTALQIDMQEKEIDILGGGTSYTNPKYALKINRFSDGTPGSPLIPLLSIDAKGAITRIGYFGSGNEQLMVNSTLGIYSSPSNKITLGLDNYTPELLWTTSSNKNFHFKNTNTGAIPISLSPNGKVGINTEDFFDNHDLYVGGSVYIRDDGEEVHSLYIEGSSIAEEMFVKLKADWPDYVFHQDYSLMPLADLEAYIDQNGRLPQMPAAAEVAKEGVATGETLRLLTQKVEELTLYILQQQKEIDALKEEMNQN